MSDEKELQELMQQSMLGILRAMARSANDRSAGPSEVLALSKAWALLALAAHAGDEKTRSVLASMLH